MTGWNYQEPEHHASTGLPISILLLSVLGISAYLLVGGSLTGGERVGSKVYLPARKHRIIEERGRIGRGRRKPPLPPKGQAGTGFHHLGYP
ncbi:membrane protein [Sinorhizobium meliloti CCBAU 01290]|nr:membrane protein [Sinorhizobium meliloti CCBAU 01290]